MQEIFYVVQCVIYDSEYFPLSVKFYWWLRVKYCYTAHSVHAILSIQQYTAYLISLCIRVCRVVARALRLAFLRTPAPLGPRLPGLLSLCLALVDNSRLFQLPFKFLVARVIISTIFILDKANIETDFQSKIGFRNVE